jgi:hypothetical protein
MRAAGCENEACQKAERVFPGKRALNFLIDQRFFVQATAPEQSAIYGATKSKPGSRLPATTALSLSH